MAARSAAAAAAAVEHLMTVKEWAVLIRVPPSTAYGIIAAGLVEPTDVSASPGGRPRLRISESAHAAYLKQQKLTPRGTRRGAR
jgi:hypothetical protein